MSTICPLCGETNNCEWTGCSEGAAACWCFAVHIPKELLEQAPDKHRNQSCICRRCVDAYHVKQ